VLDIAITAAPWVGATGGIMLAVGLYHIARRRAAIAAEHVPGAPEPVSHVGATEDDAEELRAIAEDDPDDTLAFARDLTKPAAPAPVEQPAPRTVGVAKPVHWTELPVDPGAPTPLAGGEVPPCPLSEEALSATYGWDPEVWRAKVERARSGATS
jgi:hypothetical protein